MGTHEDCPRRRQVWTKTMVMERCWHERSFRLLQNSKNVVNELYATPQHSTLFLYDTTFAFPAHTDLSDLAFVFIPMFMLARHRHHHVSKEHSSLLLQCPYCLMDPPSPFSPPTLCARDGLLPCPFNYYIPLGVISSLIHNILPIFFWRLCLYHLALPSCRLI